MIFALEGLISDHGAVLPQSLHITGLFAAPLHDSLPLASSPPDFSQGIEDTPKIAPRKEGTSQRFRYRVILLLELLDKLQGIEGIQIAVGTG